MVSDTSALSIPARATTASRTAAPKSWAGVLAKAPLKLPTAVRAAETITTLVIGWSSFGAGCKSGRSQKQAACRIEKFLSRSACQHNAPAGHRPWFGHFFKLFCAISYPPRRLRPIHGGWVEGPANKYPCMQSTPSSVKTAASCAFSTASAMVNISKWRATEISAAHNT